MYTRHSAVKSKAKCSLNWDFEFGFLVAHRKTRLEGEAETVDVDF